MKFKFIKQCSGTVPTYGGNRVQTGDVIELDGHLARKAAASPDYQSADEPLETQVPPPPPAVEIEPEAPAEMDTVEQEVETDITDLAAEAPKRRGRPPKVRDGDQG